VQKSQPLEDEDGRPNAPPPTAQTEAHFKVPAAQDIVSFIGAKPSVMGEMTIDGEQIEMPAEVRKTDSDLLD